MTTICEVPLVALMEYRPSLLPASEM